MATMSDIRPEQNMATGTFLPYIGGGDAVGAMGGGGGGLPAAFDMEGGSIVRCGLAFGRKWLECADTPLDVLGAGQAPAGVIYATVLHNGPSGPALSVHWGASLPENGVDASHRGLYVAHGTGSGASWTDVRAAVTVVAMD